MRSKSLIDLSDGHAKQSLRPASQEVLSLAFRELVGNPELSGPGLVRFFTENLSRHTGQPYRHGHVELMYSASVAVNAAAQFLRHSGRRTVGVVSPTVDTIAAQFPNAGLRPLPIPEAVVMPDCDLPVLARTAMDALLVVTPGNPSGARLGRHALTKLIEWSVRRRLLLIVDMSFRMFDPQARWDVLNVAEQCDADVIVIDDTGKTLSIGGVKLAVISCTRRLREGLSRICHELRHAVPELDLLLLGSLLAAERENEVDAARALVRKNWAYLARRLHDIGHAVPVADAAPNTFQPTVAWLAIGPERDRVVAACRDRSLELNPGDSYYWDTVGRNPGSRMIRLALLRDAAYLSRGIDLLAEAIVSVRKARRGGDHERV